MATSSGQCQTTNKNSQPPPMLPRSVEIKLWMRPTRLDGVEVEGAADLSVGAAGELEAGGGAAFCLDLV